MLACLHSGAGDFTVRAVGRADMNNVNVGIDDIHIILGNLCALGSVFGARFFRAFPYYIAEIYDFNVFYRIERREMFSVCNAAAADDAYAKCF